MDFFWKTRCQNEPGIEKGCEIDVVCQPNLFENFLILYPKFIGESSNDESFD